MVEITVKKALKVPLYSGTKLWCSGSGMSGLGCFKANNIKKINFKFVEFQY